MAWEERNGRRYYYRKVRRGGRIFSVYEGGGLGGKLAESRDEAERATRAKSRADQSREAARQDKIDALIDESWRIVEQAARSALEAAGYHQHNRGWRLKRNARQAS